MYILSPPDTLNPVVDIAMDSWGRVWTSIYIGYLAEGGIAFWNGSVWEDFDVSDGLAGPNVKGLAIDSEDNVWVATSAGVSKISAIASAINEAKNPGITIFPNPSNDVVYLRNEGGIINQVMMYDIMGALIYTNNNPKGQLSIDVSSFAKGLYFVKIHLSDMIISKKIHIN